MGWGEPHRPAWAGEAERLKVELATAEDMVAAAVADRAELEVELAAERDRADRMAAILLALYEHRPPDDRPRVLADHDAARAASR